MEHERHTICKMEATKSPVKKKAKKAVNSKKTVVASSDKENVSVPSGKVWQSFMSNQGEHIYVARNEDVTGLLDPVEARQMALQEFYEKHVRSHDITAPVAVVAVAAKPSPVPSAVGVLGQPSPPSVQADSSPEKEFGGWTPESIFSTPPKCKSCTKCPCIVDTTLDEAYEICDDLRSNGYEFQNHNLARKKLYRFFAIELYGHTGKGKRKVIPGCVVAWVRMHFPDENDKYMGHRDGPNEEEEE